MTERVTDFLIAGGGVIGLSIARELKKRGVRRITVVESGVCGRSSSWAAAGMLGPQAEADEANLFLRSCLDAKALYPDFSSELHDETGIDIELDRAGTLSVAFSREDSVKLHERFEWQRAEGLPVELLSATEIRRAEPFVSTDVREGLFFAGDWQVDNRKLCSALRKFCEDNEITILENTPVTNVLSDNGRVTGIGTSGGSISSGEVILAAGAWTSQILPSGSKVRVNIEPVRGQMIALQTAKRLFEHVVHSSRGYIVPRSSGRILAGSTTEKAGFDNSTTEAVGSALFNMACEISPSFVNLEIADHWSGLRPRTADGLPVIGRIKDLDGLYLAAGHYRNGILLAPLTARMAAADLMDSGGSAYSKAFSPDRFSLRAVTSGN